MKRGSAGFAPVLGLFVVPLLSFFDGVLADACCRRFEVRVDGIVYYQLLASVGFTVSIFYKETRRC
jgi:hypothetical protein